MSSNKSQFAFVDEYGDPNLSTDKSGVSSYFIVTAVLVDEEKVSDLEKEIEAIRKKHFKSGEIKSSKVGKNDKRRLEILKEVSALDFHIYALVVNKEEVQKDSGLKYKKSFMKFINGLLYRKLYRTFPELNVVADEHGRSEFMLSFENYIIQNHVPNLFYRADFEFADSEKRPLVQIADFLSGTIARLYEPKKKSISGQDFLKIVDNKVLLIDEWPPRWGAYKDGIVREEDQEGDRLIRQQALLRAKLFIEEHDGSEDPDTVLQVRALRYLLYQYKFVDSNRYIPTKQIIEHMKSSNFGDISEHYLRSKVIGPLRDFGVIIASSNKGLKIPSSLNDVVDYVGRINDIIQPMLGRLETARRQLLISSKNRIDIVGDPRFDKLRKYLPE